MPLLFSYGTLQQADVQLATFGRLISGTPDSLSGYQQFFVEIEDSEVIGASGKVQYPIIKRTGDVTSKISGTLFDVTPAELEQADQYEVPAYKRV